MDRVAPRANLLLILIALLSCVACFGHFEERDSGDADADAETTDAGGDGDADGDADHDDDQDGDADEDLCSVGYRWTGDGCADIDECAEGAHDCAPAASCTNTDGGYECACPEGYEGDGTACVDIDECATGAHDCHEDATCTNTEGSFECACGEGFAGDGRDCADVDECAEGTDVCDDEALCSNAEGGFDCACLAGAEDRHGDGTECVHAGRVGHVVLIGHDYFQRSDDVDLIVGSAVLLAPTTGRIGVLAYTEHADTRSGGEVSNTDAAIAARLAGQGRTMSITELTDAASLADELPGHHVVLVYEQERAPDDATLEAIGEGWGPVLQTFVRAGGVVVVCDFSGGAAGTWQILRSAGLLNVISSAAADSGATVTVRTEADPTAWGLSATYTGTSGTRTYFVLEGVTVARTGIGASVVVHKLFRNGADFYALPYDFYDWDEAAAGLLHRAVTAGYEAPPVVAAVRECTDESDATAADPDGTTYEGEYNSTLGALTYAGVPVGSIRRLANRSAVERSMGSFDVLLFPEQESCALNAEEWRVTVSAHVLRGGRVVATTSGGYTDTFIDGLTVFGRGSSATAAEPYAAEDDPFWEGITHPGRLNATSGWTWRGLGLHRLAVASDGATLTVFGYDM